MLYSRVEWGEALRVWGVLIINTRPRVEPVALHPQSIASALAISPPSFESNTPSAHLQIFPRISCLIYNEYISYLMILWSYNHRRCNSVFFSQKFGQQFKQVYFELSTDFWYTLSFIWYKVVNSIHSPKIVSMHITTIELNMESPLLCGHVNWQMERKTGRINWRPLTLYNTMKSPYTTGRWVCLWNG